MTKNDIEKNWHKALNKYFEEKERNLVNELVLFELTISRNLDELQLALRDQDIKTAKEIIFTMYKKTNFIYNEIITIKETSKKWTKKLKN